jgi:hypothetical protein
VTPLPSKDVALVAEALQACDITLKPAFQDIKPTPSFTSQLNILFTAIMQDPDRIVESSLILDPSKDGEATSLKSPIRVDTTPPAAEASSFTSSPPAVSAPTGVVDEATKKAVDSVLYSDVSFLDMRLTGCYLLRHTNLLPDWCQYASE